MGQRRFIRLKETVPNLDEMIVPAPQFVARSDKTLGTGPFRKRSDSNGFIVTGNDVDPNAEPVVLLGGSFVECSYCPEGSRFVDRAERAFPGYRFLNGGYSGTTTLQTYNCLISKVYPIVGGGAGKVVFFIGQSDKSVLWLRGSYWNAQDRYTPVVPAFEPTATVKEGPDALAAVLEMTVVAARVLDINLILAISPFRVAPFSSDPVLRRASGRKHAVYTDLLAKREQIRRTALDVAARLGVDIIDFQELTGGNVELFYDEMHLNETGQEKFAALLVAALKDYLPAKTIGSDHSAGQFPQR